MGRHVIKPGRRPRPVVPQHPQQLRHGRGPLLGQGCGRKWLQAATGGLALLGIRPGRNLVAKVRPIKKIEMIWGKHTVAGLFLGGVDKDGSCRRFYTIVSTRKTPLMRRQQARGFARPPRAFAPLEPHPVGRPRCPAKTPTPSARNRCCFPRTEPSRSGWTTLPKPPVRLESRGASAATVISRGKVLAASTRISQSGQVGRRAKIRSGV